MEMQLYTTSQEWIGPARDGLKTTPKTEISSDFQTFLRMLTAQMQNQNPLEPIQASDFAVQLATFSGVEQQVRTNDLLSELTTRMGLSELANWVGREALTPAPHFLGGAPLRLVLPQVFGADRAELVLRDLNGAEAGRYPVALGTSEILFEVPHETDGGPGAGNYRIEMQSFSAGNQIGAEPVLGYSRIMEARSDSAGVLLVLDGGYQIDSRQVVGLRQ